MKSFVSPSFEEARKGFAFWVSEAKTWDDIRNLRTYVANPGRPHMRMPEIVEAVAKIDVLLEQRRKYKSSMFGLSQKIRRMIAAVQGNPEDDFPLLEASYAMALDSADDASRFARAKEIFMSVSEIVR